MGSNSSYFWMLVQAILQKFKTYQSCFEAHVDIHVLLVTFAVYSMAMVVQPLWDQIFNTYLDSKRNSTVARRACK